MNNEYARVFVRACFNFAASGVLNLNAEECIHLLQEVFIMADFLKDKSTKMLACNEIGFLFEDVELYNKALKYQQLNLALAVETENKVAQIEAYINLANVYSFLNNDEEELSCYEKAKNIAIEMGYKDVECQCYGKIGILYHNLEHHDNAIESFKHFLAVAMETKNAINQKIAYINLAAIYKEMKDFSEAINCYEEWLNIATEDDQLEKGEVYDQLGTAYQALDSYQEAQECHEKCLEIAKNLQDQEMEEQAYKGLANLYAAQSNFQKAIDYYGKELDLAITLKDKMNEAEACQRLGMMYAQISVYDMAMHYSEKAIEAAVAVDEKSVEALANSILGKAYYNKGDYEKGLQYSKRCLEISANIGFKHGQAQAYDNLGSIYLSSGRYCEAIENQTKVMNMYHEIGNKMGIISAHINLGSVYKLLGQDREAIAHYKKGQEIAKQIDNRCGEGRAIGGLGNCFLGMNKLEEAIHYIKESLKIALELNDRHGEQTAYINLVKCNASLGRFNGVLEMADKQINLAEELGDKDLQSTGYVSKGDAYLMLKDYQQALGCFEKGLEIAQQIGDQIQEVNCFQALGRFYFCILGSLSENKEDRGKKEEYFLKAKHHLRESLRCKERLFAHLQQHDQLKISLLETFIIDYKTLTIVLSVNKEHKEALMVSERGRARALSDLLVSTYHLNQPSPDPISYAEIEDLAKYCSILFYSLQSNSLMAWAIDKVVLSLLLFDVDGLSDIISSAYNKMNFREVKCEDRLINTEKPAKNTLHQSHVVNATERLVLSSIDKTNKRCIWETDLQDDNQHPLESLYDGLISPLHHLLTKDEIVIIPDGVLFTLPFAALRDPNSGKYLSETKRIRVAPSLTSLKTLQECPADFHSKTGALIIGNPKVGKVVFKGTIKEINDLPCAELEAKKIGQLLDVKPYIGSQATKEIIKQNLREGVAVIHFAAHGTTDGEIFLAPSTTHDLLSEEDRSEEERSEEDRSKEGRNEEVPSEEDYILTMKEVQESGVRPQLVVLSCCHSGRGEIKADGVVGMSRAFLAAGARAVVASLWAIADEATMVFMEKFYTHLKHGESASQSLQAAMKDMREIPMYNDEQYWGPFFLIGDDVTIKF